VGVFEASPLIMTLGMAGMLQGVVIVFDKQHPPSTGGVPDAILGLANNSIGGYLPYSALLWMAIGAGIIVLLHRTGFGRVIYAVGDNKEACRLAGIPVAGVLVAVYTLSGLVSSIGGILLVGFSRYANPDMGAPFLLPSVAAVVIGGTSIAGGSGGYGGTIIGVLLLTVLDGLLTLLNIGQAPQAARFILYGTIVLLLAWTYIRTSQQT
jgi:ribose transport system permease protein